LQGFIFVFMEVYDFKKVIAETFDKQQFLNFIGAKLTVVEQGYCEIELPYKDELTQQNKFYHAGVVGTLADNAAGMAAFSMMEEGSSVLSVEYKVNLMSPAKGELLIARAKVIKAGRTITVCSADVFAQNNGVESLCATATVTLIALKNYNK
jgi:uncharacterized protein (TIGR00369 family)